MRRPDFEAMDFDELWVLHEELTKVLAERIIAEKRKLEARLTQLSRAEQIGKAALPSSAGEPDRPRRKYPKVLPKYSNPSAPAETWSGRGRQPRWLVAALKSGRKLEEFKIPDPRTSAREKARHRGRS
jgi:DNA-binding protein H-NS